MITLTKNGNAVKFLFEDSQHYLIGDGEIEVPVNSLSLIIDESEMVTFKKASSDDIFVSFNPADSNLSTKDGVIDFYKNNMVGSTGGGSGSGVTSGEVQTMIDASLEDYPTIDDVDETLEDYYTKDEVDAGFSSVTSSITAAVSGKADTSAVTSVNNALTAHTADTTIHVTSSDKTAWSAKQEALVSGTNIKTINNESILGSGNITISGGSGGSNVVELTQAQYEALVDKDPDVLYVITDAPEISISGKADTSAVTAVNDVLTAHTANTGIHVSQNEKNTWNGKQNALTAGTGIDITNDVISVTGGTGGGITSGEVQTMIEDYCDPKEEVIATALNDLNDRVEDLESGGSSVTIATAITSSSTNDEAAGALATYNAITAATTGGGATYSAGTNIEIDTANTINCTLPITAQSGSYGVRRLYAGSNIQTNNVYSCIVLSTSDDSSTGKTQVKYAEDAVAIGSNNTVFHNGIAIGHNAMACEQNTYNCVAIGNSVSATGTTKMNLNNQIKVDTNNQVYIKDKTNTTDVCIQDAIAALGGLKFVKLTQSEYDQLATKDANTLYIISNVVS